MEWYKDYMPIWKKNLKLKTLKLKDNKIKGFFFFFFKESTKTNDLPTLKESGYGFIAQMFTMYLVHGISNLKSHYELQSLLN